MATPENYYTMSRPEMQALVPGGVTRVLDVGCGGGAFGEAIKQSWGAEVWGIELDAAASERASNRLDKVIRQDALSALPDLPDAYFDCVVMNDVLEHLVEPEALLAGLHAKLTADATLVVSLPNVRYYRTLWDLIVHAEWEYADDGVLDRTHLRFYTRRSMRRMFERNGYRVRKLIGITKKSHFKIFLMTFLSFGYLRDCRYLQFACVIEPVRESASDDRA